VIFLTLPELIHIGERTMGEELVVRDYGLLESALARPRASAFGEDAYLSLEAKAAALVHSLARNHGLVDGNKRLALAGLIVFLGANGVSLTLSNDEAFDLISQIAEGELDEVDAIAERIARGSRPRHVAH
jgi:death-on-curing protein